MQTNNPDIDINIKFRNSKIVNKDTQLKILNKSLSVYSHSYPTDFEMRCDNAF